MNKITGRKMKDILKPKMRLTILLKPKVKIVLKSNSKKVIVRKKKNDDPYSIVLSFCDQ